jgi:hypothetical protein
MNQLFQATFFFVSLAGTGCGTSRESGAPPAEKPVEEILTGEEISTGESPASPPRLIVLVSIDTLRADHVGAYGSPVQTPNLDRIASEGLRFARAWSNSPTTIPSHASMMTGLVPHSHGAPWNGAILPESNMTLAEILREHGYATGAAVGGVPLGPKFGLDQGFDVYDAPLQFAGRVTKSALRFLDEHPDQPTFLFVHYWDVHWPYDPPPPYDRMYRSDDLSLTGSFKEIVQLRKSLKADEDGSKAQSEATKGLYA